MTKKTPKEFDNLKEIEFRIPEKIEPMKPIVPPDGYKVTPNTKIKYLAPYPEFKKRIDNFLIRLNEKLKTSSTYDSFTIRLKEGNAKYLVNFIVFYEEKFEERNGNLDMMYDDFVELFNLTDQEIEELEQMPRKEQ